MLGRMASVTRLGTGQAAAEEGEAAGDGTTNTDGAAAAEGQVAQQHATLIRAVVGKMAKIQREGRGRRYRVSFYFPMVVGVRSFQYRFYVKAQSTTLSYALPALLPQAIEKGF